MGLNFGIFKDNPVDQHGNPMSNNAALIGNLALQAAYSIYDPDTQSPTATSTFTAIYDGLLTTQYNLAAAVNGHDIGILLDLQKVYQITSIIVYAQPTLANHTVFLSSSVDGTTFTARENSGVLAANAYTTLSTAGYQARYLRIYANNSAANYSLNIIQVEVRAVE